MATTTTDTGFELRFSGNGCWIIIDSRVPFSTKHYFVDLIPGALPVQWKVTDTEGVPAPKVFRSPKAALEYFQNQ